jgi:hypothetical protein
LRFNFVVAAYLFVRFTPQFLRAWHLELFTKPSFDRPFEGSSNLGDDEMESKLKELLQQGPVAINLGLQDFAASLETQGIEVLPVNWAPPAGGNPELMAILDELL